MSVEDKLPKMVCSNCSSKLEGVHKFASMAVKMQDKLKNYLNIESVEEPSSSSSATEEEINHTGSLLHSILTNVSLAQQIYIRI